MSSLPVLKARGLHLSSNQTSAVPEGAMSQADNLVIPFRDVVQSRRGQAPGPAGFGSSGDRGNVLEVFNDELVSQFGSSLAHSAYAYAGKEGYPLEADTFALWVLNESSGTATAVDTGAGAYSLNTAVATPTVAAGQIATNSRVFNGVDNGLRRSGGTVLQQNNAVAALQASCTVEAWIKPSAFGIAGTILGYRPFVPSGTADSNDQIVFVMGVTGHLRCFWETGASVGVDCVGVSSLLTIGAWHHVAVTRTPTGAGLCDVRFYINGVLTETFTGKTAPTGGTGGATQNWCMGINNTAGSGFLAAALQYVRVSTTARTAGQIRFSYERGVGRLSFAEWTTYSGSYSPPDPTNLRMKFLQAAQNLYFTTSLGVYFLDALTSTPALTGVPKPFNAYDSYVTTSGGSWLPYGESVAYRAVWGIKDANGNVKLGPPGGRVIATNAITMAVGGLVRTAPDGSHAAGKVTGTVGIATPHHLIAGNSITIAPGEADFPAGAKTVVTVPDDFTFTYNEAGANVASTLVQDAQIARGGWAYASCPAGVTTSHFVRIYRSRNFAAGVEPDDELYQVLELKPTGADIITGYFSYPDVAPESMLGAPLYTNPESGDGALAANERPPIARDVCLWDDRAWYVNTTDKHRFFLNLLGIGTPSGLVDNDTITIAGRTYTFQSPEVAGAENVTIANTLTAAQNVELTAKRLCFQINFNPSNTTVYAYYVSPADGTPGQILIEERAIGGAAFTVYASRLSAWSPGLTTGSSGAFTSENDRRPNGLSFSKRGQPEAVPLTNWLPVGPKNQGILRCVPLRDKMIVFMTNGKVWTVSGTAPYRVDPLDDTATLLAADTAVPHSNQVFALTTQGLCAISDAGVKVLSEPIESELLKLTGAPLASLKRYAFGVSYEADRQYQLWLPSASGDTVCSQAYVYNSLWNTWTRWTGSRGHGLVHPSLGLLVLADGTSNKVRVERKLYSRTDFADDILAVTVTVVSGNSLTLSSATGVTVGDIIMQGASVYSLITAINGNVLTVLSGTGFLVASAEVFIAITCEGKWAPAVPNGPGILKEFIEAVLHFQKLMANVFNVTFDTETTPVDGSVLAASSSYDIAATGEAPVNKRRTVTRDHHQASRLRVGFTSREAWSVWALEGYTLKYEAISDAVGR